MAEEKASELRECPFCGGTPQLTRDYDGDPIYIHPEHDTCPLASFGFYPVPDEVEAWNRRTPTPVTGDVGGHIAEAGKMVPHVTETAEIEHVAGDGLTHPIVSIHRDDLEKLKAHTNNGAVELPVFLGGGEGEGWVGLYAGPGEASVRALEWVKHPAAELWRADTMLGRYQVYAVISQVSWAFDAYDGITRTSGDAADPDAAKGAAQADYEARLRSALVAPTIKREG